MKNFIFNGVHSNITRDLITQLTAELKSENVIFISSLDEPTKLPATATSIEIKHIDAIYGRFTQDNVLIEPELLKALSPYLYTTLKMMGRNAPELTYGFEDRLNMYFEQIRYWNSIIDKYKIDYFIGINYPHEVYDYVLYSLCKVRDIKIVFFSQIQVNGYVQLLNDIELNDPNLQMAYSGPEKLEKSSLSYLMQKHLDTHSQSKATPFYMELNQKLLDKEFSRFVQLQRYFDHFKAVIKKIIRFKPIPITRISSYFFYLFRFGSVAENDLFKTYSELSIVPDLNTKYLYLPLHYQPECTTCPQGHYFANQELMLDMVLAALPENISLFVKEHPFQRVNARSKNFYERYANTKNLFFVKKTVDTQALIKGSIGVITISGTAGWEALFHKKNVLLFGNIFFQYAPGVFQVDSLEKTKQAINDILSGNNKITEQDMFNFLYIVDKNSIHGWVDPLYEAHSEITYEDNLKSLIKNLLIKLKS